ncbi:peptide-methionine (S)-S-oxide reductase [Pseudahrensia aquimaris]|uniref:peptide-methionine (S)-S-oxide reductase n=1 Tax=Pseudahrensia aquimaris TaxID=744461 RepID=A0ABW3FBU2_9HYPH
MQKIGLGGGCHWCTEAVFQPLRGVESVEQGFIASTAPDDTFSEAVIVTFDPDAISLSDLIAVHLATHASTSNHSMRGKYRSAVYVFSDAQMEQAQSELDEHSRKTGAAFVTSILPFAQFKPSAQKFQNYYKTDPERPFCKAYIDPKLAKLRSNYADLLKNEITRS